MKLHKNQVCFNFRQNFFNEQKGIVWGVVHAATPNEVNNRYLSKIRFIAVPADAGLLGGQIRRTEHLGTAIQIVRNLPAAKGVVAHGNDVCASVKNRLRLLLGNAQHTGIFPVHHSKIRAGLPYQPRQMAANHGYAAIRHHIANGK